MDINSRGPKGEFPGNPYPIDGPEGPKTPTAGENAMVGRSTRGLWQSRGWYGGGAAGAVDVATELPCNP